MGTPDFAVPSLRILIENGYNIVAVVTTADKVGGRGNKQIIQSAVKKFALEYNLPILQPEKLRDLQFVETLKNLNVDLQIVVAFRMLPEIVWNMPKIGTINLHGSLLPKYRGAAPINWAIINGDNTTGVTTFFLQHEIDTGNILLQESIEITTTDNAGSLHDKMMYIGAEVVLKTVKGIEDNALIPVPQNSSDVSHAPKLFMNNCEINFNQSTENVHNFIRGLSPFPTAWFRFQDLIMKVYDSKKIIADHSFPPNHILIDKKSMRIATADGFIQLLDIQLEGKKRMSADSFLMGLKQ